MGRHSIPDPDDADDRGGSGAEPYRPEPDQESDADYGSGRGDTPAGDSAPEFGDFGYETDDYRSDDDYRAEDYRDGEYRDDDYRADEYDEPAPAPRGFPAVADEDQPTQAFSVTGR